jgi:Fic family protein
MTYLETVKKGEKEYYYLTKNIRISLNKWKKIRVYIGNKKPTKKEISKYINQIERKTLKEGLKKEKSRFSFLSEHDAETLQDLKESYRLWLKKTPKSIRNKLEEDLLIRFTYNSNAIEGNRLTLRQTALILKDKVIPSGIRANDYNEAINGKECLEYLKSYKNEFNKKLLTKVNGLLTKNTDVVYSGRIRFFDVKIFGSNHIPPKHEELNKHLLNLSKWYSANKRKLHVFELAAIMHAKIAWIHPFEDGNGRTARTIMNFILMKKRYPMFFIPYEKREDYYKALEIADKGDYKTYISKMIDLIIDQVRSYGHSKKKE